MFIYCVEISFSSCFLLLILSVIVGHAKFLNFYGEACARLQRNFSIYGDGIHGRTLFIRVLSWLLFSAPDFHLKTLRDMWVDGIIQKSVWKECMEKISTEWQEFVFFVSNSLYACALV